MMDIFFSVRHRNITGGRVFVLVGELDASTSKGLAEQLTGPEGSLVVVDLSQLTFHQSLRVWAKSLPPGTDIENGGTLVMSRPGLDSRACPPGHWPRHVGDGLGPGWSIKVGDIAGVHPEAIPASEYRCELIRVSSAQAADSIQRLKR